MDDNGRTELARHDERLKSLERGRTEDRAAASTLSSRLWGVVAVVLGLVITAIFRQLGS